MEWTRSKPTEAGDYWYWDNDGHPVRFTPVWFDRQSNTLYSAGPPMEIEKWPGWWQRIERPAPPHVEEEQC